MGFLNFSGFCGKALYKVIDSGAALAVEVSLHVRAVFKSDDRQKLLSRLIIPLFLILFPSPSVVKAQSMPPEGSNRVLAQVSSQKVESAQALVQEGQLLLNQGKAQLALTKFQQAAEIYKKSGDRRSEGNVQFWAGVTYGTLGNYQSAANSYKQAQTIYHEVADPLKEGTAFNSIGESYYRLGQLDKAAEFYNQALKIYERMDGTSEVLIRWGTTLNNVGAVYDDRKITTRL